jgi:hypothetical protein
MQRLSVKLQLASRERSFDELYLHSRINRTEWRSVCSVRGRDVLYSSKLDMQRLSIKLQLACGEQSFDELHLQRRMDGTTTRMDNHIRDVLWWLPVPAVNRHIFWYNLRRDVKLCSVCRLQVAHRFQWFDQSIVLVIQHATELRLCHHKSMHIIILVCGAGCKTVRHSDSEHYLYVKYRIHAVGVFF